MKQWQKKTGNVNVQLTIKSSTGSDKAFQEAVQNEVKNIGTVAQTNVEAGGRSSTTNGVDRDLRARLPCDHVMP